MGTCGWIWLRSMTWSCRDCGKRLTPVTVVTDAEMVGGLKSPVALLCCACLMDRADIFLYLCPSKSEL